MRLIFSRSLIRDVQLKESPHPPAPSPYLGEGEQDIFKVPLLAWATVYTQIPLTLFELDAGVVKARKSYPYPCSTF